MSFHAYVNTIATYPIGLHLWSTYGTVKVNHCNNTTSGQHSIALECLQTKDMGRKIAQSIKAAALAQARTSYTKVK